MFSVICVLFTFYARKVNGERMVQRKPASARDGNFSYTGEFVDTAVGVLSLRNDIQREGRDAAVKRWKRVNKLCNWMIFPECTIYNNDFSLAKMLNIWHLASVITLKERTPVNATYFAHVAAKTTSAQRCPWNELGVVSSRQVVSVVSSQK